MLLANYLAFHLRFDGSIPRSDLSIFYTTLPWLVLVRASVFIPFRLYEGLWRYTGIWDLKNIILGVLVSTIIFYGLVYELLLIEDYPRAVFIIDTLLLIFLMGGIRLTRRLYRAVTRTPGEKRVLI
jgi:FlaA1/EpsC-like NDP-sugar epimerase